MHVHLIWKVPDEPLDRDDVAPFHDRGIYPSGELMGVVGSEAQANEWIETLEQGSPSGRFGEHEEGHRNDMDDAPYRFTISRHEVTDPKTFEYDESGAVE